MDAAEQLLGRILLVLDCTCQLILLLLPPSLLSGRRGLSRWFYRLTRASQGSIALTLLAALSSTCVLFSICAWLRRLAGLGFVLRNCCVQAPWMAVIVDSHVLHSAAIIRRGCDPGSVSSDY